MRGNIMSSNLNIEKVCSWCGNTFTAKKTVTKYCSHKCNSAAYKDSIRRVKIEKSNQPAASRTAINTKEKEYLKVREAAALLNCSVRTIHRIIKRGLLPGINISERKTIVRRKDIEDLFTLHNSLSQIQQENTLIPKHTASNKVARSSGEYPGGPSIDLLEQYSLAEIREKYKVSDKALNEIAIRFNIPKTKIGWYVYMPKRLIDQVFSNIKVQNDIQS